MLASDERERIRGQMGNVVLPAGAFTETFPRYRIGSSVFTPTSGTMYMNGVSLPSGVTITNINCVTGSTASGGVTTPNFWMALYDVSLRLLGQSTSDTGQQAANTLITKALTTPVVLPYSGLYYLALMSNKSTNTASHVSGGLVTNAGLQNLTPLMFASSTTGLAGTAPDPAAALTSVAAGLIYMYVT